MVNVKIFPFKPKKRKKSNLQRFSNVFGYNFRLNLTLFIFGLAKLEFGRWRSYFYKINLCDFYNRPANIKKKFVKWEPDPREEVEFGYALNNINEWKSITELGRKSQKWCLENLYFPKWYAYFPLHSVFQCRLRFLKMNTAIPSPSSLRSYSLIF